MEPISTGLAVLVGTLGVKVSTDFVTNIENRVFDAIIDAVDKRQQPILTALEYLQKGLIDLLAGQQKIRAAQIKQIEMFYENGKDFLTDAKLAVKKKQKKQKKQKLQQAIEAFTSAKNVEEGTNAARAALLVGACYHLLYLTDPKHSSVAHEERWYEEAFQLAEQSRGPDGKPPRELIRELLGLSYLSGKHGTFEVYWKKWEPPKLIGPPRVVEALPGVVPPLNRLYKSVGYRNRPVNCVYCGKNFSIPYTQFPKPLYCAECKNKHFWLKILEVQ